MKTYWEYKTHMCSYSELEAELNSLGREHWELVSTTFSGSLTYSVLKRVMPSPEWSNTRRGTGICSISVAAAEGKTGGDDKVKLKFTTGQLLLFVVLVATVYSNCLVIGKLHELHERLNECEAAVDRGMTYFNMRFDKIQIFVRKRGESEEHFEARVKPFKPTGEPIGCDGNFIELTDAEVAKIEGK
jgi:hypothetical protein